MQQSTFGGRDPLGEIMRSPDPLAAMGVLLRGGRGGNIVIGERRGREKKAYLQAEGRKGRGKKSKGSPYSITERRVPELIPVLDSHPAGNVSHNPLRGLLPILLLGKQRHDRCEQFA